MTMYLNITETDEVTHRRLCEYAAWYTDLKALPGRYEIVLTEEKKYISQTFYGVKVPAVVTEDYYAAHYGGVPISDYDTKKNAGKPDTFGIGWDADGLLRDRRVELTEEEYDTLLEQAIAHATWYVSAVRKDVIRGFEKPIISEDVYRTHDDWEARHYYRVSEELSKLTHNRNSRRQEKARNAGNAQYPNFKAEPLSRLTDNWKEMGQ